MKRIPVQEVLEGQAIRHSQHNTWRTVAGVEYRHGLSGRILAVNVTWTDGAMTSYGPDAKVRVR